MNPITLPDWLQRSVVAITSEQEAITEYDSIINSPDCPEEVKSVFEEIRSDEMDHQQNISEVVNRYMKYYYPDHTKELNDIPCPSCVKDNQEVNVLGMIDGTAIDVDIV